MASATGKSNGLSAALVDNARKGKASPALSKSALRWGAQSIANVTDPAITRKNTPRHVQGSTAEVDPFPPNSPLPTYSSWWRMAQIAACVRFLT
jgi:hypothetical protein